MFAILFRVPHLVLVLPSASAFDAAKAALLPFADEREARDAGLTAEDYSTACQSIQGQEMSIEAAKAAGILDEDGQATENASVYVAA